MLDFIICTNTDVNFSKDDQFGTSGAVVKKLMERFLGQGHLLYMDNWYNSPTLSSYLDVNNTGTCGTIKANRKHVPHFSKKLKRGD